MTLKTKKCEGLQEDNESNTEKKLLESFLLKEGIIAKSEKLLNLYEEVQELSDINAPVLITGESGTGKELVARSLHDFSRRSGDFIALNCTAIPDNLFESELFGSVRGAFSDAINRPGKLELSNHGTIFLDEIGDMPLITQPKLLRFLEEKEIVRIGDTKINRIDTRIVAATNKDLDSMMDQQEFREDLYERLACFEIKVPPLRERKDDIPALANYFLRKFSEENNWKKTTITKNAMDILLEYEWPRNVRELANVMNRASLRSKGKPISPEILLKSHRKFKNKKIKIKNILTLEEIKKKHIQDTLKHTGGNKKLASEILNISRDTLHNNIKKYKIERV